MVVKHLLPYVGLVTGVIAAVGGGISGISWGPQRIDVFGVDSKNDVFHKYFTAFGWGPDDPKHGNLELFGKADANSPVSSVTWGANRMDFVFVDEDGAARHKYWDGTSWGPNNMDGYDMLGNGVSGKLAFTSWGENRFDVVGRAIDNSYVHKAWTGRDYYPPGAAWESLGGGGNFISQPAAVSWGKNRLDVFGVDITGNVVHKFWVGDQWIPGGLVWEDLGHGGDNGIGASVAATSPQEGRFDVWAIEARTGHLLHKFWDGHQYQGWENLGGNFSAAPQVVHWNKNRIDILGKDSNDGSYQYKFWDGHQWHDWANKGGPFHSEPAVVNVGENNLNFFGIDKDGKLKLQVWDGSQWLPDYKGWYELGNTKVAGDSSVVQTDSDASEKLLHDLANRVRIELKFRA